MAQIKTSPLAAKQEQQLLADILSFSEDPHGFVMYAFPWGKTGTPLEGIPGPRSWQTKELLKMKAHIAKNIQLKAQGKTPEVYKCAVSSGRGIGKSTFVAWVNLWMMSCHPGSTTINTANTEVQLISRTFAELGKWHTMAINSHWFEKTALALKVQPWLASELNKQIKLDNDYYYAAAQTWSEEKPDSFAGAHNMIGFCLFMDEASGIPAPIWKVSEGFFTEPTIFRFWFVFSNPRRNTGTFFECFHKNRNYWNRTQIDSRTVEGTDRKVYDDIIAQNGEDSDEARIEVKGEFPRQGAKQFISRDLVDNAVAREVVPDNYAALCMGVDVARYGDDSTVIWFRQGRNARIIEPIVMRTMDNMEVANEVASLIDRYNPDAVCIDAGAGSGVIDRLRELNYKIHEVPFGGASPDEPWANMRTWMWNQMRLWLEGGCIPDNAELISDLTGPEKKFQGSSDKIRLQTKEEMRADGLSSPDRADALALTFAARAARKDLTASRSGRNAKIAKGVDYKILS